MTRLSGEFQRRIDDVVARGADEDDPTARLVRDYCDLLEAEDRHYLSEVKMTLRKGVIVFEQFESDTARSGGQQLMTVLKQLPRVLESYQSRLVSGVLSLWLTHPE